MKIIKNFSISITLFLMLLACNSKISNSYNDSSSTNLDNYCTVDNQNCDSIAKTMGMTLDEYHEWQKDYQQEIESEDEHTDQNGDINYNSESSSSDFNDNDVDESRPCPYCNKEVTKPSLKNNPTCETEYTKTTNPGYMLCDNCQGYGYKITNLNCDCIDGIGWCYDKDCPVSSCENGWVKCSHCNGTGQNN